VKLPEWVHSFASLVTILGLPVTLVALAGLFEVAPISISFPQLPWSNALALVVYFLLSVAFGKAFSAWFAYFDLKLCWSRLVTIPVLALVSVSQTFVAIEILFGAYAEGISVGTFAILMVIGLALEVYFLLLQRLPHVDKAMLFAALCFVVFGYMLASEADPEVFPQANNRLMFGVLFGFGMMGSIVVLMGLFESGQLGAETDGET